MYLFIFFFCSVLHVFEYMAGKRLSILPSRVVRTNARSVMHVIRDTRSEEFRVRGKRNGYRGNGRQRRWENARFSRKMSVKTVFTVKRIPYSSRPGLRTN